MQSLDRHVTEATLMASSARYCDLNHGRLDGVQDMGHSPKGCGVIKAPRASRVTRRPWPVVARNCQSMRYLIAETCVLRRCLQSLQFSVAMLLP
jgi:hypothetical protein